MSTLSFIEGDTYIDDADEFFYYFQIFYQFWRPSSDVFGDLGIQVNEGAIRVDTKADKSYGLDIDGTTAVSQLRVAAGDGIELIANYGVTIDLYDSNEPTDYSGLEFVGSSPNGELRVKLKDDSGLTLDTDGLSINNGCGLTFESGKLVLNYAANSGLKCVAEKLSINTRYGVGLSNDFLDVITSTIDFSVTPVGFNPISSGEGLYFQTSDPKGLYLAPGDWLYIVP